MAIDPRLKAAALVLREPKTPATSPSYSSPPVKVGAIPTPPAWWKNVPLTAATGKGAETSFLRLTNALIPFLGTQEQLAARTFLGLDTSKLFQTYLNLPGAQVPGKPQTMTQERGNFLSSQRAAQALARLDQLRKQAGLDETALGPGYAFLRQALDLLKTYGIRADRGEQGMTRAEYETLQTQLSSMAEQAKANKSFAPYAELAQQFINPVLQAGQMMPKRTVGGQEVYGNQSRRLFS